MQPDCQITIQEFPILDREGFEYGLANEAVIDIAWDGDVAEVLGVRFDCGYGRPYVVVPSNELGNYEDMIRRDYDSVLDDALIDWINSKSSRIADARNRAAREAV